MTRREQILVLLEHYRDVLEGLTDRTPRCSGRCGEAICERFGCADEGVLALMCRAWNHASYQQLERLRGELARVEPRLNAHLMGRFYGYFERRVAWCRKCGQHLPAKKVGTVHSRCRIKGRTVTLSPHVERVVSERVRAFLVAEAVDWLESHWRGEVVIPPDVDAIERERKLRKVAA